MAVASSLGNCPVEIIRQILGNLSAVADLSRFSRTSRSNLLITQPLLYSTLNWAWIFDLDKSGSGAFNAIVPPIVPFLRTIIPRPDLADLVKDVIIRGSAAVGVYWEHHWTAPPRIPVPAAEIERLVTVARSLGINISITDALNPRLRMVTMDSLVALLLSQLPNLSYLFLNDNVNRWLGSDCRNWEDDRDGCAVGQILRSAICEGGPARCNGFRRLTRVRYERYDDIRQHFEWRNTLDVLPIFYLRNLEHLEISIDNPLKSLLNPSQGWTSLVEAGLLHLRSLAITILREPGLAEILRLTPRLEKLCWAWSYSEAMTNTIDLTRVVELLSPVRNTLTELSITTAPQELHVVGSLENLRLKHFDNLAKLLVPLRFLMSGMSSYERRISASLPAGLEALIVASTDHLSFSESDQWWETKDILPAFSLLLEDCPTTAPRLREIRLPWGAIYEESWELFKAKGSRIGVSVEHLSQSQSMVAVYPMGTPIMPFIEANWPPWPKEVYVVMH